jgi:ribosomal-protein-alanine N-acetyltransferase
MHGLVKLVQPTPHTLHIRPAQLADRPALTALTEHAHRVHFNLDWWTFDQWLYPDRPSDAIWLATFQHELVGLLLLHAEGPTAWVRALAIANGYAAEPIGAAVFDYARSAVRASGIQQVALLAHPVWVSDLARRLSFTMHNEIVSMRKSDRALPPDVERSVGPFGGDIVIRAAALDDLDRLAAIDRAAFDSTWWHSASSLAHILQAVPHFIVAEVEQRVTGYAFSDIYGGHGHLIRLVVHPASQRQGLGEQLLRASLQYQIDAGAGPFTLNTQIDNLTAQSLYIRYGYQAIGRPTPVLHWPVS